MLRHQRPHVEPRFRYEMEGHCSICELICVGSQMGLITYLENPPFLRALREWPLITLRLEHENPPLLLWWLHGHQNNACQSGKQISTHRQVCLRRPSNELNHAGSHTPSLRSHRLQFQVCLNARNAQRAQLHYRRCTIWSVH